MPSLKLAHWQWGWKGRQQEQIGATYFSVYIIIFTNLNLFVEQKWGCKGEISGNQLCL